MTQSSNNISGDAQNCQDIKTVVEKHGDKKIERELASAEVERCFAKGPMASSIG